MKDKLIEIQQGILDVQSKLADATEERLHLLGEVADLRQKLREFEAAGAALDSYELYELSPGQFIYKSKGAEHTVEHYACPQCHNSGKVTVMQSRQTGRQQTQYKCSTCKFSMFVGPNDAPEPINYRQDWRV